MFTNKLLVWSLGLALTAVIGNVVPVAAQQDRKTDTQEMVDNDRITLEVDNSNWLDVRVFVSNGSLVRRIGTVTALTTREFTLPRFLNPAGNDLQIILSPIGSRSVHRSVPLLVNPGDRIQYRVAGNLRLSHVQTVS